MLGVVIMQKGKRHFMHEEGADADPVCSCDIFTF